MHLQNVAGHLLSQTYALAMLDRYVAAAADAGGSGPALVLLHPGRGDSCIWLPVLGRLPARCRVIMTWTI